MREVEFRATGESPAGVEFFSWQWDFEETQKFIPDVYVDRDGVQTRKFKPGTHSIAIKAVDNDGLEGMEIVKIKINGTVEQFNNKPLIQ